MDIINVIGGIKSEPLQIKEEKVAVEIGIQDIHHSSDEENVGNDKRCGENVATQSHSNEETNEKSSSTIENLPLSSKDVVVQEKLVLNYAQNGEGPVLIKRKHIKPGEIDWSVVYNSNKFTDCTQELGNVKIVEASKESKVVAPHEYTSLSRTKHVCNYCQKAMAKKSKLFGHITTLHRTDVSMYQCPFCPFKSKYNLKGHILLKHKDERDVQWFQCHSCSQKFRTKSLLVNHMIKHFPNKIHQCHICRATFNRGDTVRRHIRMVHNREAIKCGKCNYVTVSMYKLKMHMVENHTDPMERPTFKCADCNYKTMFKLNYTIHKRLHVIKIFCDKCAYKTNGMDRLKLHILSKHKKPGNEDLKYQCDQCDYKTFRYYNFTVHRLNHLKPEEIQYFYCYHCDFKAKRKDNLKTHVLRHFKKEEVELHCYLCDFSTKKRSKLTGHIENNHTKA